MAVWPGNEATCAHIRKWRPSQRTAATDHGEFEAMKTPIDHRTLRCDEDQFHAKMMVSTSTVCEIPLLNIVVVTRMRKMALS